MSAAQYAHRRTIGHLVFWPIILAMAFFVFGLPYFVQDKVNSSSDIAKFVIQTISGNWSPDGFKSGWYEYYFGVSAAAAILLNNGAVFAIWWFAWNFFNNRRKVMEIAQAVDYRDGMVLATIKAAFATATGFTDEQKQNAINLVRTGYLKGTKDWATDYLPNAVGETEADRLKSVIVSGTAERTASPQP